MKKVLAKLRTKSFWVTLASALALLLSRLGWTSVSAAAQEIVEGVASVLLLCGVIASPAAPDPAPQEAEEEDKEKDEN